MGDSQVVLIPMIFFRCFLAQVEWILKMFITIMVIMAGTEGTEKNAVVKEETEVISHTNFTEMEYLEASHFNVVEYQMNNHVLLFIISNSICLIDRSRVV